MLLGSYEHKMDEKGRLILPVKFRQELGSPVLCTVGIEKCVAVYSLDGWKKLISSLEELPYSKSKSRNFKRVLFSMASEVIPDKAGRIVLSPMLREYAEIDDDVTVMGLSDRVELWKSEKWNDHRDFVVEDLSKMIEEVMD